MKRICNANEHPGQTRLDTCITNLTEVKASGSFKCLMHVPVQITQTTGLLTWPFLHMPIRGKDLSVFFFCWVNHMRPIIIALDILHNTVNAQIVNFFKKERFLYTAIKKKGKKLTRKYVKQWKQFGFPFRKVGRDEKSPEHTQTDAIHVCVKWATDP